MLRGIPRGQLLLVNYVLFNVNDRPPCAGVVYVHSCVILSSDNLMISRENVLLGILSGKSGIKK